MYPPIIPSPCLRRKHVLNTVISFTSSNAPNVDVTLPYEYHAFKPAIVSACINEIGRKVLTPAPSRIHIEAWNAISSNSFNNDHIKELVDLCVMNLVVSSDGRGNKLDLLETAVQKAGSFFCSLLLERNPTLKGYCDPKIVNASTENLNILNNLKQRYNSIAHSKGMPIMQIVQQQAFQPVINQQPQVVQQVVQQQQRPSLIQEGNTIKGLANINGMLQYVPLHRNQNQEFIYQINTPQGLQWVKWFDPQQQMGQQVVYQQPVQTVQPVQYQQPVQQQAPLINENGIIKGLVNINGAMQYIPLQTINGQYCYQANTTQGLQWVRWNNPQQVQAVQQPVANMYQNGMVGGSAVVGVNGYNPLVGSEFAVPVNAYQTNQTILPDMNSERFGSHHVDPTTSVKLYADVSQISGEPQQQIQQPVQYQQPVQTQQQQQPPVQQPVYQQPVQQPQPSMTTGHSLCNDIVTDYIKPTEPEKVSFNNFSVQQTGVNPVQHHQQQIKQPEVTSISIGQQPAQQVQQPQPVQQSSMTQAEFDRHSAKPMHHIAINTARFSEIITESGEQIIQNKEVDMNREQHRITICGNTYELDTVTRTDRFICAVSDFTKLNPEKVDEAIIASSKQEDKITKQEREVINEVLEVMSPEQIVMRDHATAIVEAKLAKSINNKNAYRSRVVEVDFHIGIEDYSDVLEDKLLQPSSLIEIADQAKTLSKAISIKAKSTPEKSECDDFAIWIHELDRSITKDVNTFLSLHLSSEVSIDSFLTDMGQLRDWLSEQSVLHLDLYRKWENSYVRALKQGISQKAKDEIDAMKKNYEFSNKEGSVLPSVKATPFAKPNSIVAINMMYSELSLELSNLGKSLTKSHHNGLFQLCKAVIDQQNSSLERVVNNSIITADNVEILFAPSLLDENQIIVAKRI